MMRNLKFICAAVLALALASAATIVTGGQMGAVEEWFQAHGWNFEAVPAIVPAIFVIVLFIGAIVGLLAWGLVSWNFGDQDRGL